MRVRGAGQRTKEEVSCAGSTGGVVRSAVPIASVCSGLGLGAAVRQIITETKRHLDGREEVFTCEALAVSPRLALVVFHHRAARDAGGFHIPAGSRTLGFFWPGRHYNLYRFTGPDGAPIAYRFDVVTGVRARAGRVVFTDLLLDVWIPPGGPPRVEDADEVEAARQSGLLSGHHLAVIDRTRRLLVREWPRIVREAEAEIVRLAVGVDGEAATSRAT